MKLLEWIEQQPAPVTAAIIVFASVAGLFLTLVGGELGAIGAVVLYSSGWLSRHLALPKNHPYLDADKHGESYFHKEVWVSE